MAAGRWVGGSRHPDFDRTPFRFMNRQISLLLPSLGLLTAVITAACSTVVPETGRKQFNILDPSKEAARGFSEFQKMKQKLRISTDPQQNAQVQRVGERLSKVMPVPHASWEFVVFEDPSPNAFALPGGKVGIHTGLFQVAESDSGMAAVIGHEVAHVIARHSSERFSQNAAVGAAVTGASYMAGLPIGPLGAGALLMTRKWSREQELEADKMGALFMARAGYDPRESIALWERFADWKLKFQNETTPTFISTHPLDETRIHDLQAYMPTALAEFRR
jgi:predicted Zn-dependent protease